MAGGTRTATRFERDTGVQALGDGAYAATCSGDWAVPRGLNGGYVAAIVLRAMEAEVGDAARPARSLTLHYLRPIAPGDVRIDVRVERRGRALSAVSARMSQEGRETVIALGAFAGDFPSAGDYAEPAPDVPAPERIEPVPAPPGTPPIAERFVVRPAIGPHPFSGAGEAAGGGWLSLPEAQALDAPLLALYTDAWLPVPFARLTTPVPAPTVDLTIHFRAPEAAAALAPGEPVLVRFRSTTSHGGYFEEDGEIWSREGVLLAQSRQLALLFPPRGAAA